MGTTGRVMTPEPFALAALAEGVRRTGEEVAGDQQSGDDN
jgi:hypothetical protein